METPCHTKGLVQTQKNISHQSRMGCCCCRSKSSSTNDFSVGIMNLNTSHSSFMRRKRKYTISVDRSTIHHVIVISDGEHEDITFELTAKGSKISAAATVFGQETEAIAKVTIHDKTDKSVLERKGEVKHSLYELAETAASILESNLHYHLLNNNCQTFCNKFLEAYHLPTYKTTSENVQTIVESIVAVAGAAQHITSLVRGSSQDT